MSSANERRIALVLTALLAIVIAAHAVLLPAGHWQPDEYDLIFGQRIRGASDVLRRICGWSPRPVSELLLFGYGSLVRALRAQLIVPVLAILWSLLGAALYGAARGRVRRPALISATLFAGFLLLAIPRDMYYWPAAALAYLPAIAGVATACILLASGVRDARTKGMICLSLAVAATSVEVAAAFVLIYAGLQLARRLFAPVREIDVPVWVWALPGCVAAAVAVSMAVNRASSGSEVMQAQSATLYDLTASLAAAIPPLGIEVFGLADERTWPASILYGLPIKLALLIGLRPDADTVEQRAVDRRDAALRGAALLLACFVSIVFAYRQFGLFCCARHVAFRQALVLIALYGAARAWPVPRRSWLAPPDRRLALVLAAIALLAWQRAPRLLHDLRILDETVSARERTWTSGMDPGSSSMDFYNGPARWLTNYWRLTPGEIYRLDAPADEAPPDMNHARSVARFFGKSELRAH